ncbi:Lactosylceramide 1,3-N-acetyl-beta-D-glucosaminyltransferase B [Halotydeus destructor]|nr:Lactosylceramide 1,3-N-acetyl-beta-D-glucosaminyltransferase B [Halotydeus destructor]
MRRLKRSLRFLIFGISLSILYILCFLQVQVANQADSDQDNLVEPDIAIPSVQLLNITNFTFLKNASATCRSDGQPSAPFMLAFVHSAPANFDKRTVIRQTWASVDTLVKLNAKVIFIVGLTGDERANFVDTYKNLTYKHLTGYKWVQEFCKDAKFVMKVDDDAFVDTYHIAQLLRTTFDTEPSLRPSRILACSMFPNGTLTKRAGKWALSSAEYSRPTYPAYCSGIAYFVTPDILGQLYVAAHYMTDRFIWIDDLFVTGIVAAEVRVNHVPLNVRFAYDPRRLYTWLERGDERPCPYIIGDIGDTGDWTRLMERLWAKTARVWR